MSDQTGAFPARILDKRASDDATPPEAGDAFRFTAEIASDRLDAYFTHMHESTLRNFATDAATGVALLDSHNNRNLGFGRSMGGVFEVEDGVSRVVSDFFTVAGIRFGSSLTYESTDDFIRAIKAGLVRDVSVGFYGGDMICDICGNSFYKWTDCPHWPGEEYAIGDKGEKTVVATFQITDARLAEVSVVYDGAIPGAMIMRATEMAEAGKLSPEMTRRLEVKYRIKLPGTEPKIWVGTTSTTGLATTWTANSDAILVKGKRNMPEPIKTESDEPLAEVQKTLVNIRGVLDNAEIKIPDGNELDKVCFLITEHERLTAEVTRQTAEVQRLQPLADDGKQYRTDLITETLAEGVRAMGDTFPEETYKGMLENGTSIEAIKKMRDAFAEQAKGRLPNGRQTIDDDQLQTPQRTESEAISNMAASAA